MSFAFGVSGDALRPYFNGLPTEIFCYFLLMGCYNKYDKLMIGGLITNIKFLSSCSQLSYLVIPMYAFGSKQFSGLGFAKYNFFTDRISQKVTVGLNASTFTMDQFTDDDGNKTFLRVRKLYPI